MKLLYQLLILTLVVGCSSNKMIEIRDSNIMILISGGTFSMGDYVLETSFDTKKNEKFPHPVILTDFEISKYEITYKEYMKFANETNSNYPCWINEGDLYNLETGIYSNYKKIEKYISEDHPIVGITWFNALNFCNWKSIQEGYEPCYTIDTYYKATCNWDSDGYRLPTEAEWEYAAKGGLETRKYQYSGGVRYSHVAWFIDNSLSKLNFVGQKKSNELNLNDMSGNVKEWCWDYYDPNYYKEFKAVSNVVEIRNPTGPIFGKSRSIRGGSWKTQAIPITNREKESPIKHDIDLGFRIVRSI
jgi:formylglycine-generating enzyme